MVNKDGQPIPVYRLRENVKTGTPREKVLHHNMLYPFHSVQEEPESINILMDIYFSKC